MDTAPLLDSGAYVTGLDFWYARNLRAIAELRNSKIQQPNCQRSGVTPANRIVHMFTILSSGAPPWFSDELLQFLVASQRGRNPRNSDVILESVQRACHAAGAPL